MLYAPSLRLVAMDEPGADIVWETPPPAALAIARRVTRGIAPRPASRMPIERAAAATIATPDPTAAPRARPTTAAACRGSPSERARSSRSPRPGSACARCGGRTAALG